MIKTKIEKLFQIILAVLTFISYKEDVVRESSRKISFRLVARWYSPFFWFIAIALYLIVFVLGGFFSVKKLTRSLKDQFDTERPLTSHATPFSMTPFQRFLLMYS